MAMADLLDEYEAVCERESTRRREESAVVRHVRVMMVHGETTADRERAGKVLEEMWER